MLPLTWLPWSTRIVTDVDEQASTAEVGVNRMELGDAVAGDVIPLGFVEDPQLLIKSNAARTKTHVPNRRPSLHDGASNPTRPTIRLFPSNPSAGPVLTAGRQAETNGTNLGQDKTMGEKK